MKKKLLTIVVVLTIVMAVATVAIALANELPILDVFLFLPVVHNTKPTPGRPTPTAIRPTPGPEGE